MKCLEQNSEHLRYETLGGVWGYDPKKNFENLGALL